MISILKRDRTLPRPPGHLALTISSQTAGHLEPNFPLVRDVHVQWVTLPDGVCTSDNGLRFPRGRSITTDATTSVRAVRQALWHPAAEEWTATETLPSLLTVAVPNVVAAGATGLTAAGRHAVGRRGTGRGGIAAARAAFSADCLNAASHLGAQSGTSQRKSRHHHENLTCRSHCTASFPMEFIDHPATLA